MLAQAAPLLAERGIELHAVATGASVGAYASELRKAGFCIHHLPLRPSPVFLFRYWCFVRRGDFDIVHVHTERAFFWYELVARLAGVRGVVRTVHNVFEFRGALWVERWVQRRLARRLLKERTVAVSSSVQRAEQLTYGLRPLLIGNWTDTSSLTPPDSPTAVASIRRQLGIPESSMVFVSVGSCQPVKNHAAILRALAAVTERCPDAHYLHVGDGDLEECEKELAVDLGIANRVHFVGSRDDISALLQASDVFLMPSSREGLPISCLEAMSCGLPVIGTDVPGLRDLVADGETGVLIGSDAALAEAMLELHGDEELRARLGATGRNRVLEDFSLARSVARYAGLYECEFRPRVD